MKQNRVINSPKPLIPNESREIQRPRRGQHRALLERVQEGVQGAVGPGHRELPRAQRGPERSGTGLSHYERHEVEAEGAQAEVVYRTFYEDRDG